jgi:hypothetical protein
VSGSAASVNLGLSGIDRNDDDRTHVSFCFADHLESAGEGFDLARVFHAFLFSSVPRKKIGIIVLLCS